MIVDTSGTLAPAKGKTSSIQIFKQTPAVSKKQPGFIILIRA